MLRQVEPSATKTLISYSDEVVCYSDDDGCNRMGCSNCVWGRFFGQAEGSSKKRKKKKRAEEGDEDSWCSMIFHRRKSMRVK